MNRNVNSHFAVNPTNISISRSSFKRDQDILTTMNFGKLVPFYVDEILPGSTVSIDTSVLARLSTPVHPTMGNAFMDVYYFFVPNRLVWEHWTDFMGENNAGPWAPTVEYAVPQVISNTQGGFYKGSIADYMGIPTGVEGISVNALPFRAYTLIWNQYFRSDAINDFAYLPLNDSSYNIDNYIGDLPNQNAFCGLETLPVAKYFDYFTGCLPEPQRGDASRIPINFDDASIVPDGFLNFSAGFLSTPTAQLHVGSSITSSERDVTIQGSNLSNLNGNLKYSSGLSIQQESNAQITINELRLAFQLQRLLEKDARGGGRYTSIILSHFGTQSPDARLQRAEYLGGKRIPININQVLQTSSTDETSPQGNTAAYSLTTDVSSSFTKSFVEHGFVIGVCCLRTEHSYQQGIERMWSRKGRFDYYWPVLANIGEQAVLNKEIYAQGNADDDGVFGYQEAWAEYRYKPNRISGAFRSNCDQSLDVWHYGDYYGSLPTLSPDWLAETKDNVDRTLAVTSDVEDQCICNFYVKNKSVLPMPTYSIPGLIDHN